MSGVWEGVKIFIATHRTASLVVAGTVGVSAVGAGGYGIYSNVAKAEPEQVQVVEEKVVEAAPVKEDVYIPEIKNVVITSESLEKDLTIYISDEEENPIEGVPFQVKLLTPKNAEQIQSYVDAIKDIDGQLAEYADEGQNISDLLKERNVDVTVTDEEGNVVETQQGDISADPLYLLYLDKETAIQSYNLALNDIEGDVYTDEDEDGVITEKEMEPGDYVLCLVNDVDATVSYEPTTYTIAANVKDKVEFKVQKEITKQIKKDVASEDGQKKEAVPVENKLTDTVEFVDSRKEDNGGGSFKETTDVVAPKNTANATAANSSKATKKDGGVTSITHTLSSAAKKIIRGRGSVAVATKTFGAKIARNSVIKLATNVETPSGEQETVLEKKKYTVSIKCEDEDGASIGDSSVEVEEGTNTISAPSISGYTATSSSTEINVSEDTSVTFKYKKNEEPKKQQYTITVKYVDEKGASIKGDTSETKEEGASYSYSAPEISGYTLTSANKFEGTASKNETLTFKYKRNEEPKKQQFTITVKYVDESGASIKGDTSETKEEGASYSYSAPEISGYTLTSSNKFEGTASKNETLTFKYKKNAASTETATLDMSYSGGTFTISASSNVSSVKVNDTDVAMKDGKGTYKVTKDGDYKLTGVATFSDKKTDSSLNVTYTVSGFSAASTEKLKDSKGNQLYLDPEGKTEATAANYEKGKKYYYKDATYNYFGWQTIDGNTYYFDKNGSKVTGTQVIQGVQYDFGSDGVLVVKGNGIDVSKYQGTIDWKAAKSAVNFAIIRCGYRGMYDGQLHEDPYFYKNMSGAKGAGVNVGVYIYSTALNEAEAVQEASMAVAMAQKAGGCSYPIYLDMEDTVRGQSSLSVDQRMAIVNAFVSTVQSSGYKAGLYCSKNWMTARMNAGALPGSCSVWIAQYNTSCTYSGRKNIWQYSSKGSVPGIKGHVDMNKAF